MRVLRADRSRGRRRRQRARSRHVRPVPVAPGHSLVLSRRHEADWFALSAEEQAAILALARVVRDRVAGEQHPDGWNVGVNVGPASGQSVMHVHLHVIPRHFGDHAEPRRAFGR